MSTAGVYGESAPEQGAQVFQFLFQPLPQREFGVEPDAGDVQGADRFLMLSRVFPVGGAGGVEFGGQLMETFLRAA